MTPRALATATLALAATFAAAYVAGVFGALSMADEWDACLEAGAL